MHMRFNPPTSLPLLACLLIALAFPVRAELDLDDLRSFSDAFGYIQKHYVDEIDEQRLLEAAVRGMLSELDPHSSWLSTDAMQATEESASGQYAGLGVQIQAHADWLEIVFAMPGTPAEQAGLAAGDRIIAIDGESLGQGQGSAGAARLRGAAGSTVHLTIERTGEDQPLQFEVVREIIQVASVSAERRDGGLGYLRVRSFQFNTPSALAAELENLARHGEPLTGLVLDLRGNPGGVLSSAIAVADHFLDQGLIVYTEGRGRDDRAEYHAGPGDLTHGLPIVVLVDRSSASASEIVAGALQANGRALVMGEPTYGKASVQTLMPLANGTGMRLTTARYYTPGGRRIQGIGIEPDVFAEPVAAELDATGATGSDPVVDQAAELLHNARRLYGGQNGDESGSESGRQVTAGAPIFD